MISKRHYNFDAPLRLCDIHTDIEVQQVHIKCAVWKGSRMKCFNDRDAFLMRYPSLSGAPRPPSLPSIRADDSSSRLGSSICKNMRKSSVIDWRRHITNLVFLWVCGVNVSEKTSSKNCCVRRRMCLSSVSSRKFFFSASWLVLISFSSFSNFSKVACRSGDTSFKQLFGWFFWTGNFQGIWWELEIWWDFLTMQNYWIIDLRC